MTAKLPVIAVTMFLNVVAAFIIFFFLLIALNGYSEGDAQWGLITFVASAIAVTLLSSTLAFMLLRFLLKRNFRGLSSGMISIGVATVTGVLLQSATCIVAVLVTEAVKMYF